MKNEAIYNAINILVILVTAVMFILEYKDAQVIFEGKNIWNIILIFVVAFIVHFIKASRLYFVLYGSKIDICTYTKIYCKVTPVSLMFPYKVGEFFRMYCYGQNMKNMLKGIVTIILDRFMDTTALLTILLLIILFNGGKITAFTYILLLFLLCILLIYFVYPDIYIFWKKYILNAKATKTNIMILKILDAFNNVYLEVMNISKGKGVILYFMSLIAWLCEISGIVLIGGIVEDEQINKTIANYLSSAVGKDISYELKQFIFVSVIIMIVVYSIIKIFEMIKRKKEI